MSYGFMRDVPITAEQYQTVSGHIGDEPAKGLVVHLVLRQEHGLRYIDVWDSEADWERFRDERVGPAVQAMRAAHGIEQPGAPVLEQRVEVVDVMFGAPS
jgi:hypothetical protein